MSRTMGQFIQEQRITMTAKLVESNPNMTDMPDGSTHWRCTFRRGKQQLTTPFSMGPALSGEPEAASVLDCLASDASSYENASTFEEWASDFGYDTDSRKAERTFRVVRKQADQLRKFLGEDAYKTLLWDTERE